MAQSLLLIESESELFTGDTSKDNHSPGVWLFILKAVDKSKTCWEEIRRSHLHKSSNPMGQSRVMLKDLAQTTRDQYQAKENPKILLGFSVGSNLIPVTNGNKTIHRQDNSSTRFLETIHRHNWRQPIDTFWRQFIDTLLSCNYTQADKMKTMF